MSDMITVRGFVATEVRFVKTQDGLHIASFRLGSTDRRYDRNNDMWVDGETNWFTVTSFRHMAQNVVFSLKKGDKVVVTGRLKIRQWVREDGKSGTTAEIDADAVGHDLMWGVSHFRRFVQEKQGAETAESASSGGIDESAADGLPDFDADTGEVADSKEGAAMGSSDAPDPDKDKDQPMALSEAAY
jgi:single-strand DNA-binding protein